MILMPDPDTAYVDPFRARKTAGDQLLRGRPDHR